MIIGLFFVPVFVLSAASIGLRHYYPAPGDKLSSWQYRVAKTLPIWWMLGYYLLWYFQADITGAGGEVRFWVLAGLIFGVLGDFYLLFRRLFLPGFSAFALGHILYLYGFATVPWALPWQIAALVFVPGLIYGPIVVRRTVRKDMLPLILFYMLLINLMLLTAINAEYFAASAEADQSGISSALPWGIARGWIPYCLALGAGLFCISDGCWAWNKFIKPLPNEGFWILATYYGGQALIVFGAIQYSI